MRKAAINVFNFSELSDKAKELARDNHRCNNHYDWWSGEFEDFKMICERIGIELKSSEEHKLHIFFSGFASQGDGACFEGTWRAKDVQQGGVKNHAPLDTELHAIAAEFEEIAKDHFYAYFDVIRRGHCTEFSVHFVDEFENEMDEPEKEKRLIAAAKKLMKWMYRQLEKQNDYLTSDEQVDIALSDLEFTENGKVFNG